MSKEDAPPPPRPPKKRRQLERCPDHWLAVWVHDENLSKEERERVQAVRDQRKEVRAKPPQVVGVLVDRENITPIQATGLKEQLIKLGATEIHLPWAPGRVVGTCRSVGAPMVSHRELREVVLASSMIVAAPRGSDRTPAWESVHYAKHRRLPITVVMPDGSVKGEI